MIEKKLTTSYITNYLKKTFELNNVKLAENYVQCLLISTPSDEYQGKIKRVLVNVISEQCLRFSEQIGSSRFAITKNVDYELFFLLKCFSLALNGIHYKSMIGFNQAKKIIYLDEESTSCHSDEEALQKIFEQNYVISLTPKQSVCFSI